MKILPSSISSPVIVTVDTETSSPRKVRTNIGLFIVKKVPLQSQKALYDYQRLN